MDFSRNAILLFIPPLAIKEFPFHRTFSNDQREFSSALQCSAVPIQNLNPPITGEIRGFTKLRIRWCSVYDLSKSFLTYFQRRFISVISFCSTVLIDWRNCNKFSCRMDYKCYFFLSRGVNYNRTILMENFSRLY